MSGIPLSRRRFLALAAGSATAILASRPPAGASPGGPDDAMPYVAETLDPPVSAAETTGLVRPFRAVAPGISFDVAPPLPPPPPPPPVDTRFVVAPVFYRGDPAGDAVYLTIDDCYSGPMVERALLLASRFGAKLTFFPVGLDVARMPALWREVDALGHPIENHTYEHRSFLRQTASEVVDAIARQRWAIEGALGRPYTQCFVRPPGGDGIMPSTLDPRLPGIGAELGLKFAGWNGDSSGWKYHPRTDAAAVQAVAANALAGFGPGSIVLFHSIPVDMAALEVVLQAARDRGLRCISMREGLR